MNILKAGHAIFGACPAFLCFCISKARFKNLGEFFNVIPGIVFFPESTVSFSDRDVVSYKRYSADSSIKPDLFTDHIDGHVSLSCYDLQPGFLHGIREEKIPLKSDYFLIIILFFFLTGLVDDKDTWGIF